MRFHWFYVCDETTVSIRRKVIIIVVVIFLFFLMREPAKRNICACLRTAFCLSRRIQIWHFMPLSLRMSRDPFPHVKTQIAVLVETNVSVYSGTATMYLFVFKSYPPNHYHNHLVEQACSNRDLLSRPKSFSGEKSGRYRIRDKIGIT